MGKPARKPHVSIRQSTQRMEEPGELKHLSTRRKERKLDSVSSGERTREEPKPVCVHAGVTDCI